MQTPEISSKNTKKEILESYDRLKEQLEQQQQAFPEEDQPKKESSDKKEIIEVAEQSPDMVMKNITTLKIHTNQTLDELEDKLVEEHKKLNRLKEAIRQEEESLGNIYKIRSEADSLAILIEAHKQKKVELEDEMKEMRASWQKEKQDMEQNLKEEKEQTAKERKREEEEYNYNLKLKRKKDEDAYKEKVEFQEKELKEKRDAFEKEFSTREENLNEKEQEFEELKAKAENFPAELEKTVKDKEKEISEKLNTQFKAEKDLINKEYQGELKLKEQTIQTLENKIKDQQDLINQLYQKVENADKNVKDIVLKAIESSGHYNFQEKMASVRNRQEKEE